jgi:hypothetical protein
MLKHLATISDEDRNHLIESFGKDAGNQLPRLFDIRTMSADELNAFGGVMLRTLKEEDRALARRGGG